MEALQRERDALHETLADPPLFDGPADAVAAPNRRAGEIARDIEAADRPAGRLSMARAVLFEGRPCNP